jgi:hypothetical protein
MNERDGQAGEWSRWVRTRSVRGPCYVCVPCFHKSPIVRLYIPLFRGPWNGNMANPLILILFRYPIFPPEDQAVAYTRPVVFVNLNATYVKTKRRRPPAPNDENGSCIYLCWMIDSHSSRSSSAPPSHPYMMSYDACYLRLASVSRLESSRRRIVRELRWGTYSPGQFLSQFATVGSSIVSARDLNRR